MLPTRTTLPSLSVPMKLPKMALDNLSGNTLEWPEWSDQFIATNEQYGVSDSVKVNNLKTFVTGRTKPAIKGMVFSGQLFMWLDRLFITILEEMSWL